MVEAHANNELSSSFSSNPTDSPVKTFVPQEKHQFQQHQTTRRANSNNRSRRLTADLSSLQDLLQSPTANASWRMEQHEEGDEDMSEPSPCPSAATSAAIAESRIAVNEATPETRALPLTKNRNKRAGSIGGGGRGLGSGGDHSDNGAAKGASSSSDNRCQVTADHGALMDILGSTKPSRNASAGGDSAVSHENDGRGGRAVSSSSAGLASLGVTSSPLGRNAPGGTGRRRSSLLTPGSTSSILVSTPSTTGGISQCTADGLALRGEQALARRFGPGSADVLGRGIGHNRDDDNEGLSLSDLEDEQARREEGKGEKTRIKGAVGPAAELGVSFLCWYLSRVGDRIILLGGTIVLEYVCKG